jgi:redox-sensitive bicupin YhaK (pirin superfamily)
VESPLALDEPFTILDVALHGQMSFPLREEENCVVYVIDGRVQVEARTARLSVQQGQAVALSGPGETVRFTAQPFSHFLVLSGVAVNEPVIEEGPFIMNSRAQIEAAIARYRSGEMGALAPIT